MIIFKQNIKPNSAPTKKQNDKPDKKPNIKASNFISTVVMPRELRAELRIITEQTGVSLGEITRQAFTAYVAAHKLRMEELEVELTE
jgi:hypothetical protein